MMRCATNICSVGGIWRFRFGLRAFFVGVTLAAAFFALAVRPAVIQRETVRYIHTLGGSVEYSAVGTSWIPKWLQKYFAVDFFQSVTVVNLGQTNTRDEHLRRLTSLKYLKELYLYYTFITDDGLVHLREIPSLELINLGSTNITDEGLIHLVENKKLSSLSLYDTSVTGAGFIALSQLPRLSTLELSYTEITDNVSPYLDSLAGLRELSVRRTRISGQQVAALQRALPNCNIVR